jgi:hypothetical protein
LLRHSIPWHRSIISNNDCGTSATRIHHQYNFDNFQTRLDHSSYQHFNELIGIL